ncbi:MAG TPA: hypothetical protein PLK80_18560, partial [bacterium]|nr:hypothetical protein [bacterium]
MESVREMTIQSLSAWELAVPLFIAVAVVLFKPLLTKRLNSAAGHIYALLIALYVCLYFLCPEFLIDILRCEGPVDFLTFVIFALTAYYFVKISIRAERSFFPWLIAIGIIFIALEEVAWGQYFYYYEPPKLVKDIVYYATFPNHEFHYESIYGDATEISLHNGILVVPIALVILAYFMVIPLICRKEKLRSALRSRGYVFPNGVFTA